MTGHDSSHDTNAQNIVMLSLAAFSISYNLPVYLHFNNTFRRDYVRMLRCQSGQVRTAESRSLVLTGLRLPASNDTEKQMV